MDISPNALCKFQLGYTFYLPKKKPSDMLTEDFLYSQGEFSIWSEETFEKGLALKRKLRENNGQKG